MDTLNNLNTRYLSILFVMIILSAPFLIPIIDNGKYPESILIFRFWNILFFSLVLSPYKNIIFKFGDNKYIFKTYFLSLIIVYMYNITKYHYKVSCTRCCCRIFTKLVHCKLFIIFESEENFKNHRYVRLGFFES